MEPVKLFHSGKVKGQREKVTGRAANVLLQ